MSTLEIDSVKLTFYNRAILTDVYLKCMTGDIVGIIGRNGSGKSSLMKLIFGSLAGENQSIRLDGQHVKQLYQKPDAVNYLPQDGVFMNYLTLSDLIKIFHLRESEEQILKVPELNAIRDQRLGTLSGGMKKLIEIIVLLYTKSKFVLLDEPFSFLSPVLVERLIPHIAHQSKRKGIILTDHQYETTWSVSSKHYVLYEGIVREIQHKDELIRYGYLNS